MNIMRNLHLEAAIWYFFTSPEFFEMAANECESTMEWFGNLAISRGGVNYGRNNQVYDAFKKAARNFRRGAEFARLGDYKVAYDAAWSIASDIRGMMEQPFHSWMTDAEFEEFESTRISNILAYKAEIICGIGNAESGMRRFLISDPEDFDIRDRDEGFPDDSIVKEFKSLTKPEFENMPWKLPDPLPHYAINTAVSCKTGEEVPWTGVWFPETGLDQHSLTFAVKGWRMQPAYRVVKTAKELKAEGVLLPVPETKAVATIWHPVIPVSQLLQTSDGMMRAKAGEPCPQAGLWRSLDSRNEKRAYKQGDIMADLGSAYGFTVWQYVGEN